MSRDELARVAREEALLGLRGGVGMAGPEIERYLSVFRDALNLNGATDRYSDPSVGYHWCGAFVYYCCLQAGFPVSAKPVPSYRYTLAAVPAWHHWATATNIFHPSPDAGQLGDIALYNHVYDNNPLDHIGIVVETSPDAVLSAEGNNNNQTCLFPRPHDCIAGFVRLPEDPEYWTTIDH